MPATQQKGRRAPLKAIDSYRLFALLALGSLALFAVGDRHGLLNWLPRVDLSPNIGLKGALASAFLERHALSLLKDQKPSGTLQSLHMAPEEIAALEHIVQKLIEIGLGAVEVHRLKRRHAYFPLRTKGPCTGSGLLRDLMPLRAPAPPADRTAALVAATPLAGACCFAIAFILYDPEFL